MELEDERGRSRKNQPMKIPVPKHMTATPTPIRARIVLFGGEAMAEIQYPEFIASLVPACEDSVCESISSEAGRIVEIQHPDQSS